MYSRRREVDVAIEKLELMIETRRAISRYKIFLHTS